MLRTLLAYIVLVLLTLEVAGICTVNLLVAIWESLTDTEVEDDLE